MSDTTLENYLIQEVYYWFGLNDIKEGTWRWTESHQDANFNNWKPKLNNLNANRDPRPMLHCSLDYCQDHHVLCSLHSPPNSPTSLHGTTDIQIIYLFIILSHLVDFL